MPVPTEKAGDNISVWEDLKRRNVYRVGVGYAALAWLLIQSSEIIFPRIGFPEWSVTLVIVTSLLGLPIALLLGWTFEITPKGIIFDRPRGIGWPTYIVVDVLIVATLALAAGIFWYRIRDIGSPDLLDFENSIAVLRFVNIGDDPEYAYISDGLTEDLIHGLVNLRSLKVAARTSIWNLATSDLSAQEIARKLNVGKMLEGSVRCHGDNVRVTAQLIDDTGFHLWSESYDRQFDDIMTVQRDIAARIVDQLDISLVSESRKRLARLPSSEPAAYQPYLQGRHYLRQPSDSENLALAKQNFAEAIALDSRFALAHGGLCETHLADYRLTRATEHFEAAELACHRALTHDDGLIEVFTALGNLYRHAGSSERAEDEYLAALKINASFEPANFGLGRAYQAQGRMQEAEKTLRLNAENEPGFWGSHMGIGNFLFRQGRFEEAVPFYETVVELEPGYAGGYTNLGSALHRLGDWDRAEAAFSTALELNPETMAYQNMGTLFYYQHRFGEAAEMHEQAIALAPADHRAWGKLAAATRYVPGRETESQGAYSKALELVEKRLAINPDEPEDLAYLSTYLVNTNRLDEAREAVQSATALAPNNPSARYFTAIVEVRSGNDEQARIELEKAIELGYSAKLLDADPQFAALRR